jgi:hypothetical protein
MASVDNDPEVILATYKKLSTDCQAIASKISELKTEADEHRLVIDLLKDLEPERKAFRLIGGVLVERTVGEFSPVVAENYAGVSDGRLTGVFMFIVSYAIILFCPLDYEACGEPASYYRYQGRGAPGVQGQARYHDAAGERGHDEEQTACPQISYLSTCCVTIESTLFIFSIALIVACAKTIDTSNENYKQSCG